VLRKDLNPREFALTFLGTSKVERGSSGVRKLKCNQLALFRGESPGFVDFLLCQHVVKLASPHYSWRFVTKSHSRIARPARCVLTQVSVISGLHHP